MNIKLFNQCFLQLFLKTHTFSPNIIHLHYRKGFRSFPFSFSYPHSEVHLQWNNCPKTQRDYNLHDLTFIFNFHLVRNPCLLYHHVLVFFSSAFNIKLPQSHSLPNSGSCSSDSDTSVCHLQTIVDIEIYKLSWKSLPSNWSLTTIAVSHQ